MAQHLSNKENNEIAPVQESTCTKGNGAGIYSTCTVAPPYAESILSVTVSCFANYSTRNNPRDVNLLAWLKSSKYANEVEAIRQELDKQRRNKFKSALPAITPSGRFTERKEGGLVAHSGFIQFDIDLKENLHIKNYKDLKNEIAKIPNVAYCGLSVSGSGYWGLVPIAFPEKHKEHFQFMCNWFKKHGIIIDPAPSNVASLRGYSYDPNAYFNHNAETLRAYHAIHPYKVRESL